MTIHKSKGLEFKAVLVPFCNWKLDHDAKKDTILWCKTDAQPFGEIGYMPLKYNRKLGESFFASDYFEEMIKAHIDNLNLLYVALTRAEEFLMINCPPASKDLNNAGDLVIKSIEKIRQLSGEEFSQVAISDTDAIKKYTIGSLIEVQSETDTKNPPLRSSRYESSDWREKIAVRKKGSFIFDSDATEKKAKINYGLLVHEILAGIVNEKEADVLIEKYYIEGQISSEDRITITDQLNRLFSNPKVRGWFNTDWVVMTEIPIITKDETPKRPDRVLLHGKNAIVIDFKTGLEKPVDKMQILEYKQLLNEMGYQNAEAYLLYIALNKVIKVV
jgi:ATP-dependent exoDNAse (exonuclease V) beta subunit